MNKSKVSIRFTSLTSLWAFRMAINADVFEMKISELTITCECSKAHVELAVKKYNGIVVESKQEA